MKEKSQRKQGITILEIMLVITILAISLGLGVLYAQSSQVRADLNSNVTRFVGYLRLQQSNANSGLNNTSHGIHLEPDSFTVFEGPSYSEGDPQNYSHELSPTMTIQNINLNGGGDDIIFDPPKGNTTDYGTLEFYSAQASKTVQIEVTNLGTINY